MKLHRCATQNEDGTIVGKNCPSAIIVFGPYVSVPPDADVRLRFDLESTVPLKITSDVVSNSARQFHGALEEQDVPSNQRISVSQRIHVFDPVRALETRVGIRSTEPADFTLSNLELSIR